MQLNDHTKKWLDNQPIWHDSDMLKSFIGGVIVGFIIGVFL